jgi:hypothetical protein
MQETPDQVLQGRPPTLKKATVEALPKDRELESLRQERIRFDGFFTGPTW